MLNEIKEYEQYTDSSVGSSEIVNSLKYKLLAANNFSGMEQAMVTIARNFLFDGSSDYTAETVATAENALRLWCGGHDEPLEKTKALQNWLPMYIKQQLLYEKVQSALFDKSANKEGEEEPLVFPELWMDIVNKIQGEIEHPSEHSIEQLLEYADSLKKSKKDPQLRGYKDVFDKYVAPITRAVKKLPEITVLRSDQTIYSNAKIPQTIKKFMKACYPDSIPNPIPESFLREIRAINDLLNEERQCAQDAGHVDERLKEYAARIQALKETEQIDANTLSQKIIPIVKCIEKISDLESKRKLYAKNLFRPEVNAYEAGKNNNDFKAITYDSIIAIGCNAGALRRYYLCCDDKNVIDSVYLSGEKDRRLNEKETDVLLKTVAAWLLNGSRPDDSKGSALRRQNYHLFNRASVINWSNSLSFYDDYKKLLDSFRLINGERNEIFCTVNPGGNCTKLAVMIQSPPKASGSKVHFGTWFDHFSIKCASDPDADQKMFEEWKKANPNGVFFRDDGAGSFLVENKIYS